MTEEEVTQLLQGEFSWDIPNIEKWNPPYRDKKTGEIFRKQFKHTYRMQFKWWEDFKFNNLSALDALMYNILVACRVYHGGMIPISSVDHLKKTCLTLRGCQQHTNRILRGCLLKLWKSQLLIIQHSEPFFPNNNNNNNNNNIYIVQPTKTDTLPPTVQPKKTVPKEKVIFSFNLEDAYAAYPRKEGKTKGLAVGKREIKSQTDYDSLLVAIENYKQLINIRRVEPKYVKLFSTFMNCWRDYLDSSLLAEEKNNQTKGALTHCVNWDLVGDVEEEKNHD